MSRRRPNQCPSFEQFQCQLFVPLRSVALNLFHPYLINPCEVIVSLTTITIVQDSLDQIPEDAAEVKGGGLLAAAEVTVSNGDSGDSPTLTAAEQNHV
jgi:hypothetical protein